MEEQVAWIILWIAGCFICFAGFVSCVGWFFNRGKGS